MKSKIIKKEELAKSIKDFIIKKKSARISEIANKFKINAKEVIEALELLKGQIEEVKK